jgi:hypothetical protein
MRDIFRAGKITCLALVVVWAPAALAAARTGLPHWARMSLAAAGPVLFVLALAFDLMADRNDPQAPAVRLAQGKGLEDVNVVGPIAPGIWRLIARDRDGRRNLYEVDTWSGAVRFIRPARSGKPAKAAGSPHDRRRA